MHRAKAPVLAHVAPNLTQLNIPIRPVNPLQTVRQGHASVTTQKEGSLSISLVGRYVHGNHIDG